MGEEELHNNAYWHTLLHFKEGKSQVDDKHFFLSKHGNTSPKNELIATVNALQTSNANDLNGTQCRYPARTRWIKEHFPNESIEECIVLTAYLKKHKFKTLYMVYTSSFMNSPASMVGHTFLRFDKDENTPLLSYAFNYSAELKGKEDNMFSYAYKGLFGGYKGQYSIIPYYEMVKRYSDMEHRDMWEYKLNLTELEIERVLLHMFEMQNFYSNYFFTHKNCSYNLLWFIELAKENLNLVESFNYITAPLDTIKELKEHNLISDAIFRASRTTKVKSIYENIEEKATAEKFLEESNLSLINKLSTKEQINMLSLHFLKANSENRGELLQYRSTLGTTKAKEIEPTTNPINANRSTKLSISYVDNEVEFGFRPAYHDIYDVDYDFNEGSYISFFDIKATANRLNSLTLLDIGSLSKSHPLYNAYSWGLSLSTNRDHEDRLRTAVKLKGGKSFDFFSALLFVEPTIEIAYRNKIDLSLGYELGILKSFQNFKLGLLATRYTKEGFLTYALEEGLAVHLSIIKKDVLKHKKEKFGKFGLFFYF